MAIKVGRWDCPACMTKGVLGPETSCPACGSARPKDVKFYLTEDAETVKDEQEIEKANAGADWVCSHCAGHNKAWDVACSSCGSARNEQAEGDKALEVKENLFNKPPQNPNKALTHKGVPAPTGGRHLRKVLALVALLVIVVIWLASMKSEVELSVSGHLWERSIALEEYRWVEDEDWSVPAGGVQLRSFEAVHHYDKVQDGTQEVTESVQVQSGSERYVCGTIDKGNGYFADKYCERPVYKTETRTKTVPKYKEVPQYATKYAFKIQRWVSAQAARSAGQDKTGVEWPALPEAVSTGQMRESGRQEVYQLLFKDADGKEGKFEVPLALWQELAVGEPVLADKATITGSYSNIRKKQ